MRDLIQEVQALLAFAILRGVRKAVGQTELLPVVFAVHTDMDVVAVHVAVIASVKVRLAIAEEHADLVAVAIGQFGTDEACVVVNVHVDGSAAGVNIAPGTHTGSPQRGTIFEFSALSFTVGVSLVLDHATHKSRIDDRGVLGSQMEVVGQRSQRIANLTLRCANHVSKDCAVGISHQRICHSSLRTVGSIGRRRLFIAAQSSFDLAVLCIHIDRSVKESVIRINNRVRGSDTFKFFCCHRPRNTGFGFKSFFENIAVNRHNSDSCTVGKRERTNLNVLTGHNAVGTALVDRNVNRVISISLVSQFTLHGELVVVGIQDAEDTTVNRYLAVCYSFGFGFRHTKRFSKAKERTFFNSRAAAIGIVARHHERTSTTLGQRTVVEVAVDLGIDRIKTLLVVLGTPSDCVFFADLFLVFVNANDVIVGVQKDFTQEFLLVFSQTFHGQLLGIVQSQPCFCGGLPSQFFAFALVKSNLRDVVRPNVKLHRLLVVVEVAKQLAKTVHALVKIGRAPAVTFVNLTLGCGPVFVNRVIRIRVRCRRKHDVANLHSTHILITRHQNRHCASHVRSSHRGTGRITPSRFASSRINLGAVNAGTRGYNSPVLR